MSLIEIKKISKSFTRPDGKTVPILQDFSLALEEGETVTLFGPNGCGKSTLLSLLAEILKPDSGTITRHWDAQEKDGVGFVFQHYSDVLHPWKTVLGNVEFPLAVQGMARQERRGQALLRLSHFGLEEHARKYVYQLSGGQKQLLSFCQATVYKPRLLLCDEPFSAMDYTVSRRLWKQLREFLSDRKMATVFVSHDIDEAIFLGDRVCVLSPRPAQIVMDIKIPFGKERSLDILKTEEFFKIRTEILSAFEGGRQ